MIELSKVVKKIKFELLAFLVNFQEVIILSVGTIRKLEVNFVISAPKNLICALIHLFNEDNKYFI